MSYFEFPHTRTYDSDLGWLIKAMTDLIEKMNNFVDLNKIKFADPINWTIDRNYEATTIVLDSDGNGFISQRAVPAGVPLSDTSYWTQIFSFGQLLDSLRENIAAANEGNSITATAPRAIGDLVWINTTLYRCVTPIAVGNTYVEGFNVEHVTVEGLINNLRNEFVKVIKDLEQFGDDPDNAMDAALDEIKSLGGILYENQVKPFVFNTTHFQSAVLNERVTDFRNTENGGTLNILVGTDAEPSKTKAAPSVFVQKHLSYSQGSDFKSHSLGAGDFEIISHGSGDGDHPNAGGYVGLMGICKTVAENTGTTNAQKWDLKGVTIGLCGEAMTDGYNGEVTAGIWSNTASCSLTDDEFDNLPTDSNFTTIGEEINIWIRHKDSGYKEYISGQGSVIGLWVNNFQTYEDPAQTAKDFTFGLVLEGTPVDNVSYGDPDVNNWNGYHTGIRIDKIKEKGIIFGSYMKNDSTGIEFCQAFNPAQERPKASIDLGDTLMNMGHYYGTTFNEGDIGRIGKELMFCKDANRGLQPVCVLDGYVSGGDSYQLYITLPDGHQVALTAAVVS